MAPAIPAWSENRVAGFSCWHWWGGCYRFFCFKQLFSNTFRSLKKKTKAYEKPIQVNITYSVEFTEDGRYLYTEDEIVTSDFAYVILETIDVEPSGTIYNIEFVDEFITQMTLFEENKLQIIGGDFYIEYER